MMIEVKNISKSFNVPVRSAGFANALESFFHREYKTIPALDDVSFTIGEGEMVGYIGPNGAGKSTTIKLLSGILLPDSGSCTVDGRIPWKNRKEHVSQIGVVFGQRTQLWWDIPAGDSFELLKALYKIDKKKYIERLDELTETFELQELLQKPVRTMSLGQKMRCEVAAALLHSPRILFLDEPTIGMDTVSKIKMRQMLKEFNLRDGITMVMTTHDMDDIESTCNRILMLDKGKLAFDGSLTDLRRKENVKKRIIINYKDISQHHYTSNALKLVSSDNKQVIYEYNPLEIPIHEVLALLSNETSVEDFTVENEPIEQLIRRIYEKVE